MTAVGCTPGGSEVDPPPGTVWIHANVLCRNEFSGLLAELLVAQPQRLGEETRIDESRPASIAHTMIACLGPITGSTSTG